MFADVEALNRVAKALLTLSGIGPLAALPDVTGLSGLKAVRMWEGFQGDESQGITEIDIVGPREGLTKLCGGGA